MALAKTTAVLISEAKKDALDTLKKIGPMMMYDLWEQTSESSIILFDDDGDDRKATDEEQLTYWKKVISEWSRIYKNKKAREDNVLH